MTFGRRTQLLLIGRSYALQAEILGVTRLSLNCCLFGTGLRARLP
jgi:hypothetical protein